ncbi:hypothetical protein AVEN_260293-1, partial [Araneus ventricosus]
FPYGIRIGHFSDLGVPFEHVFSQPLVGFSSSSNRVRIAGDKGCMKFSAGNDDCYFVLNRIEDVPKLRDTLNLAIVDVWFLYLEQICLKFNCCRLNSVVSSFSSSQVDLEDFKGFEARSGD